ncbi:MAG: exo-alpha-sialidase [Armatimonadota bacterium]
MLGWTALAVAVLGLMVAPGAFAQERPSFRELGYRLHPPAQWLAHGIAAGALIPLEDGRLLWLTSENGGTVRESADDGATWEQIATMYEGAGPGRPTQDLECGNAIRTPSGAIIYFYRDFENKRFAWDDVAGEPIEASLDVWAMRSLDGGRTWIDRQRIYEGWCGAINDMIVTRDGAVVVPIECLLRNPGRHGTYTVRSTDDGATWQPSNLIDLGGHGHHDGAMEATLTELADGRLLMFLRTTLDRLWRAWSFDGGRTWRQLEPTDIPASNAPAFVLRLQSGRLVLVWNPLTPGKQIRPLAVLAWHGPPASAGSEVNADGWRNSLLIAVSEDEGATWGEPRVLAEGPRLCYPQVLERRPGELWISFVAGADWTRNLVRIEEAELLAPVAERPEPELTIVAFGDSTTAPRSGVATYAAQLDWALADRGVAARVINAGVGGNTTAMARARFDADVLAHEPDVVIIQFGICDSAVDVWKGATKPRVAIDEYEANLQYFAETLQARGARVILMTPNPLRWTDALREMYGKPPYAPEDPDGFNLLLRDYAERVRAVAGRTGATLVDAFAAFEAYGRAEGHTIDDLLLDGMHPNSTGQALEAELLLDAIGR